MGMMNLMVGSSPRITVSVSPDSTNTATGSSTNDSVHSVTVTGGAASSYSWSATYPGSIVSGGSTSIATLRVTDDAEGDLNPAVASYNCDVVVNGITYQVTVNKVHDWQ
jgi:hypothetical protein